MSSDPFSKHWCKLPEHVSTALREIGLTPVQKDAEVFKELWYADPNELIDRCMQLLPLDMRTNIRRVQTEQELYDLLRMAKNTAHVHNMQPWEVQQCIEEMQRAGIRKNLDPLIAQALAKWRHWKPNPKISTVTQRQIEVGLADKWLSRLLSHFAPYSKYVPALDMHKDSQHPEREWKDLFGDARHNSLKGHCMTLESMLRSCKNLIPWDETKINCLLNQLRDEEATPQKVQRCWNTLKYLSEVFNMLNPESMHRLRNKKSAVKDDVVKTLLAPQRRANTPELADIIELEGLTTRPGPITDQYAAAIFRLLAGVSGRWNDICHTQSTSMRVTSTTIEFTAWQTKTTSINDTNRPMPLIAPLHSFSGVQWWTIIQTVVGIFQKDAAFQDMDYLLPVPTRDRSGFCPRPCSNGQALRWLRLLRAKPGRPEADIKRLTLASFRVWMADLAYQANISRDKRRYIGRWASENTADTYTREHRQVICNIWDEVIQKIDTIKGGRSVPEDLHHEEWHCASRSAAASGAEEDTKKRRLLPVSAEAPSPTEGLDWDEEQPAPQVSYCDNIGPPIGPLTIVSNNKATGKDRKCKIHLLNPWGQAVGCGWKPKSDQTMAVTEDDYKSDTSLALCSNCFKQYQLPRHWNNTVVIDNIYDTDESAESLSASSDSNSSVDTTSDTEALKLK